ncbi:hypothetical protein OIU79_012539 [Salix purpurea]|uniref:Uncharacterized protein n=1 Tax=Salix purpurea TaxID=77065 RepID=A0A9Q0T3L4_SALPP|nr:hypothetical protein OIU79_012539 [Salix purpurea]
MLYNSNTLDREGGGGIKIKIKLQGHETGVAFCFPVHE